MKDGANVIFSTASRKNSGGSTSEGSDEWTTPRPLFDALHQEFTFGLDAAATPDNALCPLYLTESMDALTVDWTHGMHGAAVYCNPPYSQIDQFVTRAVEQAQNFNLTVVLLIPARPERKVWRTHIWRTAHEIRFISGRLSYGRIGKPATTAPVGSAVIVYRGRQPCWATHCFCIDREGNPI